jgi:hypothetical protein
MGRKLSVLFFGVLLTLQSFVHHRTLLPRHRPLPKSEEL